MASSFFSAARRNSFGDTSGGRSEDEDDEDEDEDEDEDKADRDDIALRSARAVSILSLDRGH